MGMDIFGRKPEFLSKKPMKIDFRSSTDEQKEEYWNAYEKWENEIPGTYFHSNIWGWGTILTLVDIANDKYKLKMDMSYWDSNNSGRGLQTQEQCDHLADALELMLNDNFPKEFMEDDSNEIQAAWKYWQVIDTGKISLEDEADLNERYPCGTIFFDPVVTKRGVRVQSPYSCLLEDIKEWILFLRECGGFKIY
jgi:hypothetical protein